MDYGPFGWIERRLDERGRTGRLTCRIRGFGDPFGVLSEAGDGQVLTRCLVFFYLPMLETLACPENLYRTACGILT